MKISVILTPEIGSVFRGGIAGTERMFFKDINTLKKYFDVRGFSRFLYNNPPVSKIIYPRKLLLLSFSNGKKIRFPKRVVALIKLIADIIYLLQVCFFTINDDIVYGYTFPLISFLFWKKRIVILQSYSNFYQQRIFRTFYQKTTFIFVSSFLRDYHINKYPFLRNSATYILHNSVDTKLFCNLKKVPKQKHGIKLLFCSAWVPEKGLDVLLEAMIKLPEKQQKKIALTISSNTNLWYLEDSKQNIEYISKIHTILKRMNNITLLGGIEHNHMPEIYNQHDYLIFPSIWGEPCSLTLIESLACGLPVIAFDVGGNKEILTSQSNSMILPNASVNHLKNHLSYIIRHKRKTNTTAKKLFVKKNHFMTDNNRESKLLSYFRYI